jgi:Zn-dependent protease
MFGSGNSFQLARVFGIRIGASASWFIVFGLVIYYLSDYFDSVIGRSDTTNFGTAVIGALAYFVSIVLHELGHALAARREGMEVTGIDLWLFGGLAKLNRDSNSPGEEFRVAAAGPLVTLLIVLVCIGGGVLIGPSDDFSHAAQFSEGQSVSPVIAVLGWLAAVNILLLLFNLIPAFPLDGGRIARSIAWKATGNKHRGTRIAGQLGVGFSYLMIAAGIAIAVSGDPLNGVWLCLIAWFINQGARSAMLSSEFSEKIGDVTARDLMDEQPLWIGSEATALQAADDFFARYRAQWLPVVSADGNFEGMLRAERADGAVAAGQPTLKAEELVDQDSSSDVEIGAETPLESLLDSDALRRHGALAVVDADHRLIGVVTADQVRRALTGSAVGR